MNEAAAQRIVQPDNRWLLALAVVVQVLLIAVPALWNVQLVWLLSGLVIAAGFALFSTRRTLLVLLVVTIALPGSVLSRLVLPGGLRLQETLLVMATCFVVIDWLYWRRLNYSTSLVDWPVAGFVLVALLSAGVGVAAGNLSTVILRDLRFPLYYGVVFLVTQSADTDATLRRFAPGVVLAAAVVSVEYVLEFAGAIELSGGGRFTRVARLQGIALPVALLMLVNQFIHDPRRYGRGPLVAAFIPISLAFVLTVGRGMWLAFAFGMLATILLWHWSRPVEQRRVWHAFLLVAGLASVIGLTALLFQRATGSAIVAYALERSLTFVDFTRDVQFLGRLSSYILTVEQIMERPLLGSGQGATLPFMVFNEESHRFAVHDSWTVDNLYLALLWKMGIPGLLAFGWMMLRGAHLALQVFSRSREPAVRAFGGGMVAVAVGMAVLGMSDSSTVSSRFAVVFGILLGLVAVVHREQTERSGPGAAS